MIKDPKERLEDMAKGLAELQEDCPELMGAFVKMDQAAYVEGELERKYKELIGLAISLFTRCEYCIPLHVKQAIDEGATREEILETCAVAVAFGGSPAMAYMSTSVLSALDAFEK